MNYEHRKIHAKRAYTYQKRVSALADDGTITYSLRAGANELHFVYIVAAEGKSYFDSYAGTTYTDDGTEQTIFNRFIDNAPETTATLYYNGTVDTLGAQRFEKLILGGTGGNSTGGVGTARVETILAPGQEITIVITNKAGQAKDYGIELEFYEKEVI